MSLADPVPLPLGGVDPLPKERIAALLVEARDRTLALVEDLCDEQIERQFSPIMSPLAWDIGHVAAFADLWLARAVPSLRPLRPDLFGVYDATETPRSSRGQLPFLPCADALAYGQDVHARALAGLEDVDVSSSGDALNAHAFVWHLLIQHEHQHNETMLQAMQLADGELPAPALLEGSTRPEGPGIGAGPETVRIEAGPAPFGAGPGGFAYDNERPRHTVELDAYDLDREPVSNGAYLAFVDSGGYRRREWWSEEGWAWREREGVERPLFWTDDGRVRRFDRIELLDPTVPVTHVSWHEAEAFARAHGKRLPTEAEWEKAATWDPAAGRARDWPWGDEPPTTERANLDGAAAGPAPAGARPEGESAVGAVGLVGDVWEWTATEFHGYPGFRVFPYAEYSQIFFGTELRVLRGGSWATRPTIARPTFRNWDLPHRRQLFVGFRCARGA
ncbi:MAG: ergothioneine biosynthesis protein EgtB [Actinomycetota bacterium]|nr:ergothioneine biosynthesis protein EgtB [Actinomycetota bacterium]